jgi:hypothetical protein
MAAGSTIDTSSPVNQIATSATAAIVGQLTDATTRIAAILERHSVATTILPEKRLLYMLAQTPIDRGSAQLYLFNLLTPFRYDWREILARLRAADRDAAIVVVAERPTSDAIGDAMRAGADELLYETELASPQLIWQRIGGFLELPTSPIPHPPSPFPELRIAAPNLRSPSGRLDATRIAKRLGVPIARLAAVVGVSRQALTQTPDSPGIQHALDPIARTLHVLDETLDPDDHQKWLRTSRVNLDRKTPLDAIMNGNANTVARLLESAREIE